MSLENIKNDYFEFVIGITVKKENEIDNFVNELFNHLPEKVLIVLFFDSSRDLSTFKKSEELAKDKKNILIIYDDKTKNLADAYFRLYKFCSNLNTKWVISMNAGWRHKPEDLIKFVNLSDKENIDCVWGYREKANNKHHILRKLISYFGGVISDIFLNIKIKDLTSGFYMIRTSVLKAELLKKNHFISKFHFFDTELKFYLKNYSFEQVKIIYKTPNNSLPFKIILDSLKVLIYLFIKRVN
ncbi:glycosyltransferase [Pelagibacterales bacterium SAG-MED47]|nr:glycosyltransferase [Pelagibacterales bacterium SAG-MED47]|tara:strand:- start:2802 stop:3527 length:726 start_codon:yes stop_codon:yes gene_type:complete